MKVEVGKIKEFLEKYEKAEASFYLRYDVFWL